MSYMAAAWDDEVCAALQQQELDDLEDEYLGDILRMAPHSSLLPVPFASSGASLAVVDEPASSTQPPSSSSTSSAPAQHDWLEEVMDRRQLRARALSSSRPSVPGSTCARDPASFLSAPPGKKGILKSSRYQADTPLAPQLEPQPVSSIGLPSSSASSSSTWCPSSTPLASSSPSTSTPSASLTLPSSPASSSTGLEPAAASLTEPAALHSAVVPSDGITRRFGIWREGRDRWHQPDGSVINRGRATPAEESWTGSSALPPIHEEENDFSVDALSSHQEEPVLHVTSAAGEQGKLWASAPCGSADSTTAGGESSQDESSATSSDCVDPVVGFWRHGQWIPRARTSSEQKSHLGGQGPTRTERKQRRVEEWMSGRWRPAWLREYIREKALRDESSSVSDGAQQTSTRTEPANPDADAISPGPQLTPTSDWSDWGEFGDHGDWRQDPESGWWFPSSSSASSWTSWTTWTTWTADTSMPSSSTWDGWAAHWQGQVPWGDLPTTSTTSSSTTEAAVPDLDPPFDLPPNAGLFPEVRMAEAEVEPAQMALSGAEHRLLQEAGLPANMIQRLSDIFAALDLHQQEDRGPESRWALARMARRAQEGLDALDVVAGLLARRLVPRGFWLVQRPPASEALRWNMFQWARTTSEVFLQTLHLHLYTPLQPEETASRDQHELGGDGVTRERGEDTPVELSEAEGVVESAAESPGSDRDRSRSPRSRLAPFS